MSFAFVKIQNTWSFAILLWEVFTLGGNPYPGIEVDEEFFKKLKNGYRMEKPEFSSNTVFKLVEDCWEAEPHDRPNFTAGEEVILRPPMEIVPMIQFSDDGNVILKNIKSKENDTELQKKDTTIEKSSTSTDYIYMGSPKKKEFPDHPFAIGSVNSNEISQAHNGSDIKYSTEGNLLNKIL
ncbi:Platelet-derived growth factor receptor alpha [Nymphon striatum]|nr:Platelet-derived growth factor receptor alpha [Nymphon striatum]